MSVVRERTFHSLLWALVLGALAGCAGPGVPLFDRDQDGIPGNADCDDENPTIGSAYVDHDGDGYGEGDPRGGCDLPESDRIAVGGDCDDQDAQTHPGALETCNSADDDCNGLVDDGLPDIYFQDNDEDGYGDPKVPSENCQGEPGYVSNSRDCDDTDGDVSPSAEEACNGEDDNCDSQIDEGAKLDLYLDEDRDGYGGEATGLTACEAYGEYVTVGGDCEDTSPDVHPGLDDLCDGKDNDCDAVIDEDESQLAYTDADGDGYGTTPTLQICGDSPPEGYSLLEGDCNDADPLIHPDTPDTCDRKDNDCDGLQDEDAPTFYPDFDKDGYGISSQPYQGCEPPDGYVSYGEDCDDGSSTIYPSASETCNQLDDDCDGEVDEGLLRTWYLDSDGDTYGDTSTGNLQCALPGLSSTTTPGDCDDSSAVTYPDADEQCDSSDNNCDGDVDEGLTQALRFEDSDGDGYGGRAVVTEQCVPEEGLVDTSGDCDDADASRYPGAPDGVGDGIDSDCGGHDSTDPHVGFGEASVPLEEALTLSDAGTTVFVAPGIYSAVNLPLRGGITLRGVGRPEQTLLEAAYQGRVLTVSDQLEPVQLEALTLRKGSGGTGTGGALEVIRATALLNRCHLLASQAGSGGALAIVDGSAVLTEVLLASNVASLGGGLYARDSVLRLRTSRLLRNAAGAGGGLYAEGTDALEVERLVLSENLAGQGGAMWMSDSVKASLRSSLLEGNQASESGGALFFQGNTELELRNLIFYGNESILGGSALYSENSQGTLSACTLVANTSAPELEHPWENAAVVISGAALAIDHSILALNEPYNLWWVDGDGQNLGTLTYSDLFLEGGSSGTNLLTAEPNLTVDPDFVDPAAESGRGLHLSLTSLLINAGTSTPQDPDGTASDLGAYGGPLAAERDLDGDGKPDYFWPGDLQSPPEGYSADDFDCDDLNPSIGACPLP